MKKMTKKDYFEQIKAKYNLTEDEVAFIDHEIELLSKKNSGEKKPTAKQTANEGLKSAILSAMEPNRLYTISELMKEVPELASDPAMTNQRVSALVRQMYDKDNAENPAMPIVRVEEKRKAYFQLNPNFEG